MGATGAERDAGDARPVGSVEDEADGGGGSRRHAARHLWMKWDEPRGMLRFGGELPDVFGGKFEATIQKLTERMRPANGQPWEPWSARAADALVLMCDAVDAVERIETPMAAPSPLFALDIPPEGPAEICGIPLPDAMVEQLRASAAVEPVVTDEEGFPGRCGSADPVVVTQAGASSVVA